MSNRGIQIRYDGNIGFWRNGLDENLIVLFMKHAHDLWACRVSLRVLPLQTVAFRACAIDEAHRESDLETGSGSGHHSIMCGTELEAW